MTQSANAATKQRGLQALKLWFLRPELKPRDLICIRRPVADAIEVSTGDNAKQRAERVEGQYQVPASVGQIPGSNMESPGLTPLSSGSPQGGIWGTVDMDWAAAHTESLVASAYRGQRALVGAKKAQKGSESGSGSGTTPNHFPGGTDISNTAPIDETVPLPGNGEGGGDIRSLLVAVLFLLAAFASLAACWWVLRGGGSGLLLMQKAA